MKNSRIELITKPLFIFGVFALLINDFYLKYEFSNFLTGKMSDIAGLFIFPYFFSSIKPKLSKHIYWLTAVFFIFWKSSYSQELINFVQSIGIGMNRTVDYSDIITLLILPVSFAYFRKQIASELTASKTQISLKMIISCVSLFAFWGTTIPIHQVDIFVASGKQFQLEMSKSDFIKLLKEDKSNRRSLTETFNDSIFKITFTLDTFNVEITAKTKIKIIKSNLIMIQLDSILYGDVAKRLFTGIDQEQVENINRLKSEQYEKYFDKNIIEVIKAKNVAIIKSKKNQ